MAAFDTLVAVLLSLLALAQAVRIDTSHVPARSNGNLTTSKAPQAGQSAAVETIVAGNKTYEVVPIQWIVPINNTDTS